MMTNLIGAIQSSRLQQSGAYPTEWEDMFSFTPSSAGSNWHNYTVRNVYQRAFLPAEATKFKITLSAAAGIKTRFSKVYFDKSNDAAFISSPTQVTFGGSPTVQLEGGDSIESDEILVNYYGDTEMCFSAFVPTDAGAYNNMCVMPTSNFTGAAYYSGDVAASTFAYTIKNSQNSYMVSKIKAFIGGQWKEVFKYANLYLSNGWNNYTIRTRINTSRLILSKSKFRLVMMANLAKCYIGNAVDGADLCDFRATPTQVTFGSNPNTPTNNYECFLSDEIPLSIIDPTKPLLISHLQNSKWTGFATAPSGTISKYKSGDFANSMAVFGGSTYSGGIMNPIAIDEFIT